MGYGNTLPLVLAPWSPFCKHLKKSSFTNLPLSKSSADRLTPRYSIEIWFTTISSSYITLVKGLRVLLFFNTSVDESISTIFFNFLTTLPSTISSTEIKGIESSLGLMLPTIAATVCSF